MVCSKIDNHVDIGLDLLISQYKRRKRLEAWIKANLIQIQNLEDVIYSVCNAFYLDSAVGDQLNILGRILNEPRRGFDDDYYRVILQAKIAINKSSGTVSDFQNLLDILDPNAVYFEKYPASIHIKLYEDLSDPVLRSLYRTLLYNTKPAGVSLEVIDTFVAGNNKFRLSPVYNTPSFTGKGFASVHGVVAAGSLVSRITA